jgi:hypothetical protein
MKHTISTDRMAKLIVDIKTWRKEALSDWVKQFPEIGGLNLKSSSEISGLGLFYIKNSRALIGQIFYIFCFCIFCFFRRALGIFPDISHTDICDNFCGSISKIMTVQIAFPDSRIVALVGKVKNIGSEDDLIAALKECGYSIPASFITAYIKDLYSCISNSLKESHPPLQLQEQFNQAAGRVVNRGQQNHKLHQSRLSAKVSSSLLL